MDHSITDGPKVLESSRRPGEKADWGHISHVLEAALGTLREQLAQEREHTRMAAQRAELAERRAARAEAAAAAEAARTEILQRRLASAETQARGIGDLRTRIEALQADWAETEAFAAELLRSMEASRQADEARSRRIRRIGRLMAMLIGAGVLALP